MKNLAALVAVLALAACASPAKKPAAPRVLQCDQVPQRVVNDAEGAPSAGLYFCYRDDGSVIYRIVPLTPEQLAAVEHERDPKHAAAKQVKRVRK